MSQLSPEARNRRRDLVTGSILLAFALVWTVTVYSTVPVGRGAGIGPRAFPLSLGILLVVLSALMVISVLRGALAPSEDGDAEVSADLKPMSFWYHMRIVATVCAIIAVYGYLMITAGFVIATMIVVAATLWFAIGVRKPILTIGMAIGLAGGSWLVFGQLLGAYMPRGSWLPFLF